MLIKGVKMAEYSVSPAGEKFPIPAKEELVQAKEKEITKPSISTETKADKSASAKATADKPEDKTQIKEVPVLEKTKVSPTPLPTKEEIKPTKEPVESFKVKFRIKLKEQLVKARQIKREKAEANLAKIVEYALKHQRITNNDVENLIDVKDDQATNYLNILVKQGKLIRFGKTKNVFYKPIIKNR